MFRPRLIPVLLIDDGILVKTKKLTPGHAKILVGLNNATFVADKIIKKKLSVRQAENFVKIFKINKQVHKKKKWYKFKNTRRSHNWKDRFKRFN